MARSFLLTLATFILIGCSGDTADPGAVVSLAPTTPVILNEDRDDPAMKPARRLGSGQSADALAPGAGGSKGRASREVLRVDADSGAVFVPGLGWQTAEAFMDIYLNRPQLLPDEFDHQAVQSLRERLANQ